MTTSTKPTKAREDALLTTHEVAEALHVHQTTASRWIRSGALPAIRMPIASGRGHYRVKASVLDALLHEEKGR